MNTLKQIPTIEQVESRRGRIAMSIAQLNEDREHSLAIGSDGSDIDQKLDELRKEDEQLAATLRGLERLQRESWQNEKINNQRRDLDTKRQAAGTIAIAAEEFLADLARASQSLMRLRANERILRPSGFSGYFITDHEAQRLTASVLSGHVDFDVDIVRQRIANELKSIENALMSDAAEPLKVRTTSG